MKRRPPRGRPSPPRARRRGFALLITVTLLAFLVLLLVSLATLTRVETQVAGNSQQLTQARQNALMALNLAVGQLQRYAGPDQRATAPSDAGASATVVPGRNDAQPHWTGVWENTTPGANVVDRSLLTWLVSGNENTASPLAVNPSTAIADPAGINSDTVWLVSDGTVTHSGTPSATNPDPRIKLPKQDIKVSGIPGLPAGPAVTGRYAWWVGDEATKARVNLDDPHATATGSAVPERGFSFVSPSRADIGRVDLPDGSAPLNDAHDVYPIPGDANFGNLDKVGNLAQLPLAVATADADTMRSTLKARFHALTAQSESVLADAAFGGLKKDLSAGLANTAYAKAALPDDQPIFGTAKDDYTVPTWGLLRSWAVDQVDRSGRITPQPFLAADNTRLGASSAVIGPVVTYAGVGVDFVLKSPLPSPATNIDIWLSYSPVVVLWNPYSTTLAAKNYLFRIYQRGGSTDPEIRLLRADGTTEVRTYRMNNVRYKIVCPDIPPGQSLIFTLPVNSTIVNYTGLNELVNAVNPLSNVVSNYQPSSDPSVKAATPDEQFVIQIPQMGREYDCWLMEDVEPDNSATYASVPPESSSSYPKWFQGVSRMTYLNSYGTDGTVTTTRALAMASGTSSRAPAYAKDFIVSFSNHPNTSYAMEWIAHSNPRALMAMRTPYTASGSEEANPAYFFRQLPLATEPPDGVADWPAFNYSPGSARASSGTGLDNGGTPNDTILFELPNPRLGLISLGQLQHAPLSLVSAYPAYAVGNSLADIRMKDRTLTEGAQHTNPTLSPTNQMKSYHDISWWLNRALWDRYFFSTVPSGAAPGATLMPDGSARPSWAQADIAAGSPLPDARLHYYRPGGTAPGIDSLVKTSAAGSDPFNQAAAHLLLSGGFNVNSTSEQAWRAVLAGTWGLAYDPENRTTGPGLTAAFPRFSVPRTASPAWSGYRQLDKAQVNELAANIVAQVKLRGPFLSLADFVNRALVADATGLKGALQAAIDATASINAATAPFDEQIGSGSITTRPAYVLNHMRNDDSGTGTAAHRSPSADAPGFLTQADVLTSLGPSLTVRGDTFIVRAYGEAVNPALAAADPSRVTARAWLEAIVQRLPDYVNTGVTQNPEDAATGDNAAFGRRFKIISFRWLSPDDI